MSTYNRRIHTNIRIFFHDPYVVRVEFPNYVGVPSCPQFTKLLSQTWKSIHGTWGYSNPEYEDVLLSGLGEPLKLLPGGFVGVDGSEYIRSLRSYFCFKDEMDALQFRLSCHDTAIRVHMWPSRLFTIHEVIGADG